MCQEKKMGLDARLEYLSNMKQRYRKAGRSEKTHLLSEMEKVTGLHRKYLITKDEWSRSEAQETSHSRERTHLR